VTTGVGNGARTVRRVYMQVADWRELVVGVGRGLSVGVVGWRVLLA
jgi:hypothetical protein